jgi:hypothetical protein
MMPAPVADGFDGRAPGAESAAGGLAPMRSWLDRPLSAWWCALGWLTSTAVFVGFVELLGGPTYLDSTVSVVSTWSIAHGRLSCAFPPRQVVAAPLYPFVSGGIAAAARIGHATPFPAGPALGPGCAKAFGAVWTWGWIAGAVHDTLRIGYVSWLALLAGVVALLRASGRGRRGWEPVTLLLVACLPPVWMCLENLFHPQDLLALGLVLGALACVCRDRWVWAGLLVGLALLTQQFCLLVAAPLFVIAPAKRRWVYVGATAATVTSALLALLASTSSGAVKTALVGSGTSGAVGGTWLFALNPDAHVLGFVARVVPLELSLALAWWLANRLGTAVLEPVPLVALAALSLSLRLVFEQSLFGYYFMALAVLLVLLDIVRGHIRATVVAWLIAVSVVFLVGPTTMFAGWPASWSSSRHLVAPAVTVAIVAALGLHAVRNGIRRTDLMWLALAAGLVLAWPPTAVPLSTHVATQWWQVVLVGLGIALAFGPLLGELPRPVALARPARTRPQPEPSLPASSA